MRGVLHVIIAQPEIFGTILLLAGFFLVVHYIFIVFVETIFFFKLIGYIVGVVIVIIGQRRCWKVCCSSSFWRLPYCFVYSRLQFSILFFEDFDEFHMKIVGPIKIIDVVELLMRVIDEFAQADIFHQQYTSIFFSVGRQIRYLSTLLPLIITDIEGGGSICRIAHALLNCLV